MNARSCRCGTAVVESSGLPVGAGSAVEVSVDVGGVSATVVRGGSVGCSRSGRSGADVVGALVVVVGATVVEVVVPPVVVVETSAGALVVGAVTGAL